MKKHYPIPENDGEIALWPDAREMIRLIQQKSELPDWMRQVKEESLRELGFPTHENIIMTGHQISLTHPGVWFKNAVISELTNQVGGHAVFVAMDTDAPKDLAINNLAFGNDEVPWMGILGALWITDLENIREKVADPRLESFFELMKRNAAGKLSEQLLKTLFTLDLELGLNYTPVLSSRLWELSGYLRFVKWFLNDPIAVARACNQAMGNNPIWKPLDISEERCESPFWVDLLKAERRQRLFLEKSGGEWRLEIGKERLTRDSLESLKTMGARLTPRALLNSIYLKTISDFFIHGVGGGEYDVVTDRFMEILGLAPIPFGVATATLYAPEAQGLARLDRAKILQNIRHVQSGWDDAQKRQWAHEMQSLPRKSDARKQLFERLKGYLKEREENPQVKSKIKGLQGDLERFRQTEKLFNRGLFHRIQPEERLKGLVDQILSNL